MTEYPDFHGDMPIMHTTLKVESCKCKKKCDCKDKCDCTNCKCKDCNTKNCNCSK